MSDTGAWPDAALNRLASPRIDGVVGTVTERA